MLATTVGVAAFYAAIPPTVRIMDEDYVPADEVMRAGSVVPGRRERVVHGLVVVLRARGGWACSVKVGSIASLEVSTYGIVKGRDVYLGRR